jgi:quinol monooxygenase YgiN
MRPSSTFGIFEVFPDKAARDAHLSGQYAQELMATAGHIFAQPTIEEVEPVAAKLP